MQDLERDLVAALDVGRAIDRAEAARGDLLLDRETLVEDRADQRIDHRDRGRRLVITRRHCLLLY